MKSGFLILARKRQAAWLPGVAAVGLLGLAVFTCVVRAQGVGEGYALARCEAQLRTVERRVHAVNTDILNIFAKFRELDSTERGGFEMNAVARRAYNSGEMLR
ncbi:MAG: hypothetical protein P8N09_05575 [Planctomycetota bacterium]|jgi:hypothetical protein|nr:hypothetical protein [Planctomycetota bacterium]